MITIIDYDAGNLNSVQKAFEYLGEEVLITDDTEKILNAKKLVLPGVGNFIDAIEKIDKKGLRNVIHEYVKTGRPFLGICLGLQLMFESSEEAPGTQGLGLLQGTIRLIPSKPGLKIPHIGWNSIDVKPESKLFKGIKSGSYVYFVHSYYLDAKDKTQVCATTDYGVKIDAAVEHNNIYACQFHPEKSGDIGLNILENFAKM